MKICSVFGYQMALAFLLVSGCQSMQSGDAYRSAPKSLSPLTTFSDDHLESIADNLTFTMSQLPGLSPLQTTIQMTDPVTPFGKSLQAAILEKGYGRQLVEGDVGNNLLRYLAENAETEQGYRTRYRVEIGANFVEREYRLLGDQVVPTSPMRISDSEIGLITVNDEMFASGQYDGELSVIMASVEDAPTIRVFGADGKQKGQDVALVSTPAQPAPRVLNNSSTSDSSIPASNSATNNVFDGRHSNFRSLFDRYETVSRVVLVFPNDSLIIGKKNKRQIQQLVGTMNNDSDIVSILGCSHGNTSLSNGNQILALGRASRTREEFMVAGLDANSIYDEGCWGSEYWDERVPRRGVIVTVKRPISNT